MKRKIRTLATKDFCLVEDHIPQVKNPKHDTRSTERQSIHVIEWSGKNHFLHLLDNPFEDFNNNETCCLKKNYFGMKNVCIKMVETKPKILAASIPGGDEYRTNPHISYLL